MNFLFFLETATINGNDMILGAGLGAFIMTFLVVILIFSALLWVYTSLAFVAIAKKGGYSKPNLAWIPLVGPLIISSQIAKMHWWPILLILLEGVPFVSAVSNLVLMVFAIIWLWKTFEIIGKPNWWAILMLIPFVNFIILGVVAWSKPKKLAPRKKLVKVSKKR